MSKVFCITSLNEYFNDRMYTVMVIIKLKQIHKLDSIMRSISISSSCKVTTAPSKISMRLFIGLSYVSVMLYTGLIKHISGLLEIQSFLLQFRLIHQNITSQVTVTGPIQKTRPIFKQLVHQDTE